MRKHFIVLTLLVALLASVALPGFSGTAGAAAPAAAPAAAHVQSHAALFDKTRFLFDMGVAVFAFHHFVYNRYKAGAFKKGASGRVRHIVEAGLALAFAFYEVHKAYGIAKSSNSKTLHALVAPINALGNQFNKLGAKFHGGSYSDSDVNSLNSATNGVQSQSSKAGYKIIEKSIPIPGLSG